MSFWLHHGNSRFRNALSLAPASLGAVGAPVGARADGSYPIGARDQPNAVLVAALGKPDAAVVSDAAGQIGAGKADDVDLLLPGIPGRSVPVHVDVDSGAEGPESTFMIVCLGDRGVRLAVWTTARTGLHQHRQLGNGSVHGRWPSAVIDE